MPFAMSFLGELLFGVLGGSFDHVVPIAAVTFDGVDVRHPSLWPQFAADTLCECHEPLRPEILGLSFLQAAEVDVSAETRANGSIATTLRDSSSVSFWRPHGVQ